MKRKQPDVRKEYTNTYQQPGEKEAKQFWSKIWQRREHKRKAKKDKQYGERVGTRKSF